MAIPAGLILALIEVDRKLAGAMILKDYHSVYISELAVAQKIGVITSIRRHSWIRVSDFILMYIIVQAVGMLRHILPK